MVDVNDARRERAELREHVRSVADVAAREERRLTDEERSAVERSRARIGVLSETIEYQDYIRDLDEATAVVSDPSSHGAQSVALATRPAPVTAMARPASSSSDRALFPTDPAYTRAFETYIRHGVGAMNGEERDAFQPYFSGGVDTRAMATAPGTAGGALIPQEFYARLFEAMKAIGGVAQSRATVVQTGSGAPMPIPLVDDTANAGALLGENTQITAQDFTFATKTLNSYVYTSKLVLVSFQMLQDAFFDIEGWLARALGTRVARAINAHFTNGTGVSQPEGVIVGAQSYGTTATGAGNVTGITYDNLVNLIHSVDPAYRDNAEWMMNDQTLKIIRQLKDSQNRPLWQQDMALGVRPTILGYPYVINQDVPVMAASAKSLLFGDFSYYLIRQVQDVRVLRLDERYADFLQAGFFAFVRTDGLTANPGGATQAPIKYYANSAT